MEEARRPARGHLVEALLPAVLGAAAFAVRCLNYRGVFVDGGVVFFGVDPFGHMRRITLAVHHFPHVPTFDYFLNYPTGADIPWPVGFDFLLALAGWLAGGLAPPLQPTLEKLCALAIPLLGALNVVLVYWVARRFFGRPAALLAAVLLSVCNAHVSISQVGRVDHHVVEPIFVPLIFLFLIGGLESEDGRARLRCAVLAGVAAGVSFLFWAGSTVFAALPALFVLACFALRGRPLPGPSAARPAAILYAVASGIVLAAGATSPFFRRFEFTPLALSWFHLLVLLLGAALCSLLACLGEAGREARWRRFTGACVLGAAAITAAGVLSPGGWGAFAKAFLYVAAKDPLAGSTVEARRLVDIGPVGLTWAFTKLWVLVPAALLVVLWKEIRDRFSSPAVLFLLLWLLTAALLASGEFIRYYAHVAAPLEILLGLGLVIVGRAAWDGFRRAEGGAVRAAGAAVLAVTILLPGTLLADRVLALRPTRIENHAWEFPSARDAFEWLRNHSPDPGGVLDPAVKPRYGVLAPWGYGFWINYIAERPNIASPNLLLPREIKGAVAALDVLLEENEAKADALAAGLGARYVVATNIYRYLPKFAPALGRPISHLMTWKGESPDEIYHFKLPFFRTLNNRMLLFDGSEVAPFRVPGLTSGVPALDHFRLVYESPQRFQWASIPQAPEVPIGDVETSSLKIFERVPGARVAGEGVPLGVVRAEIEVRTNRGRTFRYRTSARCDRSGLFELRLPYATAPRAVLDRTTAFGRYEVSGAGVRGTVRVGEAAVRAGARVTLDRAGTAREAAQAAAPR